MTLLVVSVAGAVGALIRYLISGWVQAAATIDFPLGTLTVNISGAFAFGLIMGTGSLESVTALAAMGFLGGFTTFSTWMIETIRLGPRSPRALLNLALNLTGGVAVATAGFALTN